MTWIVVCPRCGRESLRSSTSHRKVLCRHEFHDPQDCGLCGECRTGWAPPSADDETEQR